MPDIPETIALQERSNLRKKLDRYRKYPMKRVNQILNRLSPNTKEIIYILSAGRSGSTFFSHMLNLAQNGVVLHQPPPGLEIVNGIGYSLFKNDLPSYLLLRVQDIPLLLQHAEIYKDYRKPIFGDGHNANYPFAICLRRYFEDLGIVTKFIHIVRNPNQCCEAILRAEGPNSFGGRENYQTRARDLVCGDSPVEIAVNVWREVNGVIDYQVKKIEQTTPGTTLQLRIEDININNITLIQKIYDFLSLKWPGDDKIKQFLLSPGSKKNSYKEILQARGVPEVTDKEKSIIQEMTREKGQVYGYS